MAIKWLCMCVCLWLIIYVLSLCSPSVRTDKLAEDVGQRRSATSGSRYTGSARSCRGNKANIRDKINQLNVNKSTCCHMSCKWSVVVVVAVVLAVVAVLPVVMALSAACRSLKLVRLTGESCSSPAWRQRDCWLLSRPCRPTVFYGCVRASV